METAAGMFIRKLSLQSFGCVRDATVEFEPLTVLVGPNDSGKTTLLQGLGVLSDASVDGFGWRGVFPEPELLAAQTFDGKGKVIHFAIAGEVDGSLFDYKVGVGCRPGYSFVETEQLDIGTHSVRREKDRFTFTEGGVSAPSVNQVDGVRPLLHSVGVSSLVAGGQHKEFDPITAPIANSLGRLRLFALRPESLRKASPLGARFSNHGLGLPTAIAELLMRNRDAMDQLEQALRTAMPHVRRVHVSPDNEGKFGIELVTRSGAQISGRSISDGVLLYLGYLYLVFGPNPASVLLVEEPETGIHFGLLQSVMKLFRDLTTGAFGGPKVQVILTTHSPMLLNLVEPEEIRIVTRGDDGATTVTPFSGAKDLAELLEYQGPGEVWVNQGEDYLTRNRGGAQ